MKWFLLAVGMFVGATALFAMVPTPALLGVADAVVRTFYALVNIDGRITDSGEWAGVDDGPSGRNVRNGSVGPATVVDGDTLDVGGTRVRLHGVDAPESGQSCVDQGARWPCGRRATRALAGRLGGRTVVCEERDRDRYGRIVAVCRQGGRDINAWLVSPKGGRWRTGGTRANTWTRSRRRGPRERESGAESSWHLGSGAEGSACRARRGRPVRRRKRHRSAVTSRGTSATTAADGSTTCPVTATTLAPESVRRGASAGSVRKPRRGRRAGGGRAGKRHGGESRIGSACGSSGQTRSTGRAGAGFVHRRR